jgi:transcriptional regulator with XRE-family HTH domain
LLARCKQAAMTKGEPIAELKVWRKARDLTLDQAAEMLSKRMGREGDPIARATYWAWENGKKMPSPLFLAALCAMTGVEHSAFYPPAPEPAPSTDPCQPALL